jgi:photosystem II protein PsbQ
MRHYRSILALALAFVTAFLVSCSSPTSTKTLTYSPTQLEQIQSYSSGITNLRGRMPELATLIENREWINVRNFIHGPLGELRVRMGNLARNLLPDAQDQARQSAQDIFTHLEEIDEAAQNGDYRQAIRNYAEAIKDFDAFFQLVPQS